MKTLIVLCSLATIAISVPRPYQQNFDTIYSSIENVSESKTREKKSPLHDPTQEIPLENEKELTQTRHSHKTEMEASSQGKTKFGVKKPIIIRKKFGYQVFRDSDEEMAHIDPNENCRKQFKLKLCDSEPSGHIHSNNKEMGKSIKMAKKAVENLEKGLLEHMKKSNSNENLESDIMHEDIEIAKSAIDHLQKNLGNLESIEFHINNPETKESFSSKDHWKDAIDKIHKNVEIAKNIEDAFKFEKQIPNSHNVMSKSEDSSINENSVSSLSSSRTSKIPEVNSDDLELSQKSNTEDEQDINRENDMFVSPTDHNESKMQLHSDSLTSEHVFDKARTISNTEIHEQETKSKESITSVSLQEKDKKKLSSNIPIESNTQTNNKDIKAKTTENIESTKLTKVSQSESIIPDSKTKSLVDAQLLPEYKMEPSQQSLRESLKMSSTGQKSLENLSEQSLASDNTPILQSKMTLHKENDATYEGRMDHSELVHQKNVDIPEDKLLARADIDDHISMKSFHSLSPEVQHKNSKSAAVGPQEEQYFSKGFSSTSMDENHNMNHLHGGNHATKDFHHLAQEKANSNSQIMDSKMEEQLNDFHESFMRLAEEKQLNDILSEQFRAITELNNELKMNQKTKNTELSEYNPTEFNNAPKHELHSMGHELHRDQGSYELSSYPLDSAQYLKSATELHDDHLLSTSAQLNRLKNGEDYLNRHTNMLLTEGQKMENMGYTLTDYFNNPTSSQRWSPDMEQRGSHGFEMLSESRNGDKSLTQTDTNKFHSGHPAHKEQNLEQLYTDSHEVYGLHPLHWAPERKHNEDVAQATEFHNEPHLNDHVRSMTINRFNQNFDLDSNNGGIVMKTNMPDHFHMTTHARSHDMDSSMQPSMHNPIRDTDTQWGHHHHHHHHHHGMARSSYSPSQTSAGANTGAIGVFSNANTGCGIPLLVSCSPSIVSGSLTRSQPMGISASAYRTPEKLMYYMKRDASKIDGNQNVQIQKAPITLTN